MSYSGAFDDEPIAAAIRRHVAWIALAQEQRSEAGDHKAADRDIRGAIAALLTLSLEVDNIEAAARRTTDSLHDEAAE